MGSSQLVKIVHHHAELAAKALVGRKQVANGGFLPRQQIGIGPEVKDLPGGQFVLKLVPGQVWERAVGRQQVGRSPVAPDGKRLFLQVGHAVPQRAPIVDDDQGIVGRVTQQISRMAV